VIIHLHSFETTAGTFHAAATESKLVLLELPGSSRRAFEKSVRAMYTDSEFGGGNAVTKLAEKEVKAYLVGRLQEFSIPYELEGPPFHCKVLRQVARIGYGKTRTYGEIARSVGSPQAARAVGSANAHNRLPLIIPCHRVLAVNGLGGYGGGLPMKKRLLEMEGAL